MSTPTLVMALIYFSAFSLSFLMGLFILYIQPRERLNRLFFLICLSVSIWGFSLSIATSSYTIDQEFFWIRLSSLGWGTLYAFLLHFTLIMTNRDFFARRPYLYVPVYFPALLTIYLFLIRDGASESYHLLRTSLGFLSFTLLHPSRDIFPVSFFYLYYIGYSAAALYFIYRYGSRRKGSSECFQCRLLGFSLLFALALGTFFELSILYSPKSLLPHLSVLNTLIPLLAIFYILRKHRFLLPRTFSREAPEQILDEFKKASLYQYIASFFILLSFTSFISQYFGARFNLAPQLFFSGVAMVFGICLAFIHKIDLSPDVKDLISACLICIAIPFITLHFSKYSSVTVGAFPFGLLLLSVLLDKRGLILMIGLSTLTTHLFITFSTPAGNIFIDGTDYWLRISFFGGILFIALHIRRLYADKLIDNEQEMNFQKEISSVSEKFLTSSTEDVENKIGDLLEVAGHYFHSDRVYIFLFSPDKKSMDYRYEWCAPGIRPAIGLIDAIRTSDYPWWRERILSGDFVYIPDVAQLTEEASAEKALFNRRKIQSIMSVSINNENGPIGFLGVDFGKIAKNRSGSCQNMLRMLSNLLSDAFERIAFEKSVHHMAYYDQTTGLPNRFYLNQRLEKTLRESEGSSSMKAILFLDIDSFKHINETIGHSEGNLLLRKIAAILQQTLSDERDFAVRFGGDEFLLVLSSVQTKEEVEEIAQRILDSFRLPIFMKDKEFFIDVSLGVSVYPVDGRDAPTLIKNADAAVYESKRLGKNQSTFCSEPIKRLVLEKIKLTNLLHRALEREELHLYYQPQVNTRSGEIVGFESLLRWKHPYIGMVSPGIFIPIAEDSGLIHSIGKWALFTACRQAKLWEDQFGQSLTMAVNLSVRQFKDPNLVDLVKAALQETGLPPRLLEIEITESEELQTDSYILQTLHELKNLGLRIAIDDFGTKYSSLSRLKNLPVDKMKIDMQFVRGIAEDTKNQGIAKSIIDLSKNLGLLVIGEGVETEEQLSFLRDFGCDEIQGYYFYAPTPAEEVTKILRENIPPALR
ncbi:MAG: EAL domain-containing protein [Peptostreptococcaceae bacterium]|nr:EAL domain-containing protein [Peptostreptococcaceae bacterium]